MSGLTRRAALGVLGVGAAGGVGVGAGVLIDHRTVGTPQATTPSSGSVTVASWAAGRGDHYFIGHRGSGDVYPEHSMEAYAGAVAGGARCLEISVGRTSDGVLICMHDASYDRTTTAKGVIADLPSTVLRGIRLSAPGLGPAWALPPQPQVPLLEDVLRAFGSRVVLCIEAKNDRAYPELVAAVEAHGLRDSVIIKASYDSKRIPEAKAAGYPVFAYFGSVADVTADRITALTGGLDAHRDYLILPTGASDDLVRRAVATGIPTWIFPVHRRSQASRFFALGCQGAVCSSLHYVSTATPTATADTWSFGAIAPGEMTKDPGSAAYSPTWSGADLQLGVQGAQHFLTLGQFGPLAHARDTYSVDLQLRWTTLPADRSENATLAFGHHDDAYYQHRSGLGSGYHAILRADGRLELYRHVDGRQDGVALGTAARTAQPEPGQWVSLRLTVSPTSIGWTRLDGSAASVRADDASVRGGYLHIDRSSTDGVLAFRGLLLR